MSWTIEDLDTLLRRAGLPSELGSNGEQPETISQIGTRRAKAIRHADRYVVGFYDPPRNCVRTDYYEHAWQASEAIEKWIWEDRWVE